MAAAIADVNVPAYMAILQRVAVAGFVVVPAVYACLRVSGAAVAALRNYEPAWPGAAKNPASPPVWKNTTWSWRA